MMVAVVLVAVSFIPTNNIKQVSAQAQTEVGNVFGYAWSSNIGWIKMNSCNDDNLDGIPNTSCTGFPFGVKIDNGGALGGPGTLSGYAWSSNIGWISFGSDNLPGAPGASSASMALNTTTGVGTFTGWARARTGLINTGFDGWISLSNPNFYPSPTPDGSRGVTYNKSTGRIVGYAWGGEVIGWIKFGAGSLLYPGVTYGVATQLQTFDFSISASSPSINHTFSTASTYTSTIILGLISGISQAVNLSITQPPSTSGVTATWTSTPNCSPTCTKVLSIGVTTATPVGVYTITVTGTSGSGSSAITHSASVVVNVTAGSSGAAFAGTCITAVGPPYYVNVPITRTFTITSGTPPYTSILMTGTNIIPVGGQLPTTPVTPTSTSYTFVKTYSTTGVKNARVTVISNPPSPNFKDCPNVTVLVDPDINQL